MSFVTWLDAQRAPGETDERFARSLGISHSYWSLLKAGKRNVTLLLVRAAVRRFPEHRDTILSLAIDVPVVITPVDTENTLGDAA